MSDAEYNAWRESLTDAEAVKLASAELSRLCKGGRWQMTIPVDFRRDSDVIFGEVIRRLGRASRPDVPPPEKP